MQGQPQVNLNFDVLGTQRAIRDDASLSTVQKLLLLCAVLRADNATGDVRRTLDGIAQDAACSSKSAHRAFAAPEVVRYFEAVTRSRRRVRLTFPLGPRRTESPTRETESPSQRDTGSDLLPPSTDSSTFCSPIWFARIGTERPFYITLGSDDLDTFDMVLLLEQADPTCLMASLDAVDDGGDDLEAIHAAALDHYQALHAPTEDAA